MSYEASHESCQQIVFLIDSNPSFWRSNYCAEDASKAIRLCVLRVLTYFSDYGKRSNLRWGYKFFDSRSLSHQVERHEFKEFLVNVFEEFEDQVLKRLNESFAQQVNASEQKEQDDGELTSFSKPPVGARCVSCALTNAVHDFQWERPDISSPVRRTRGYNNSLYHDRTKTRNVIFLLSGSPCNDSSISEFIGENASSLATLEGFKSTLMPSVLYKEFKERRICLQWVNIENCQQEKNTSLKSLLEVTVEQLGGCLIPLSAVIYTGNSFSLGSNPVPSSSGLDHSTFKQIKSSMGQLLPFKTVMDFHFRGKETKLSAVVGSIAQQENEMKMGGSDSIGFLCSSGAEEKVHCSVKLHSMFPPVAEQEGSRDLGNSAMTDQASAIKLSTSNDDESITNLLWMRGVINHTCVSPTWLHPTKGYSCIGMDDRTTDDSTNSRLGSQKRISGWYQGLLLSLAKENKLLVIDFVDCDSGLPVTGVLQPLTSICGVISVIASDFLVAFEKLPLWLGKASVDDRKKVTSMETRDNLSSNYRSTTVSEPAESLRYPEVFLRLMGSHNYQPDLGTNDVAEFEARFVDPWFSFPILDDRTGSFWNELKRGNESEEEEDDDVDNEAALMKELKDLYNKKETNSASTACNVSQLTKHSKKEKLSEKSEVKNASLTLRRNHRKETNVDDHKSKLDENKSCQPADKKDKIDDCSTTDGSHISNSSSGMQQVPCVLKDEAELRKVIHDLYNKVILEGANILHEITNIVTVVSQFMGNGGVDRPKEIQCVSEFLRENLLHTVSELRAAYEGCSDVIRGGQQVREYQLQIMLRMEIAAHVNADENSSLVEEVTVLLRAISFMKDPKFLTIYLREVLLRRYRHSLAKFLCGVYEGLMMRPPREVSTPSKWSSDDESPVRRSIKSVSSAKQDSNQPRSSGCRIITRHLSVTDAGGKRREIVVPGKAKLKDKEKPKKEKPQASISSRGASKKEEKKTRGHKTPVKLVRRNLFTESEEGDENNSTARAPRKRKLSEGEKKEHARRRFHRRNTVGSFSKSTVQETPAHKQVSHALWCKQDRARKRSRAHTEVHVLQESPLKELQAGEGLPRRSPRRPPAVIFQRSQSFYGRSASAGPLTRTRSFSGAYFRDSPKKEPIEGSDSIPAKAVDVKKTPQKLPSVAFSPLRFSPRQKKKFSLHSLLSSSKECDQKRESLPGRSKPTTPKRNLTCAATRSSPRLLKKRSFSCIGFSSVSFPKAPEERKFNPSEEPRPSTNPSPSKGGACLDADSQEGLMKTPKKEKTDNLSDIRVTTPTSHRSSPRLLKQRSVSYVGFSSPEERKVKPHGAKPRSRGSTSRASPVKKDRCSDGASQNGVMKTPDKQKSDHLPDIWATTPKSNIARSERRTPLKDYHMDECVVLLTPIRKPLKSPLHVSPKVIADLSSCSQGYTHQDVIGSSEQVDSAQGTNENERTPVKNSINAGFRSSPRLLCKRDNTDTSQQILRESSCKPGDSKPTSTVSLKSTQSDLAKPSTPGKVCHLDDCVVLLTPLRGLSKSPARLRSQEKHVMGTSLDFESALELNGNQGTNIGVADAESGLLSGEVCTRSKSPHSSPQSIIRSARVAVIDVRLGKKSLVINRESTSAKTEGTEWFSCMSTLMEDNDKCRNNSAATDGAERTAPLAFFHEDGIFPRSTRVSPTGAQFLWSQRPQNSTPPPKRNKKKSHSVSNSPAETKRLSPLNQILRQQKRKRCFAASPADKCSREASEVYTRDTSCVKRTPNRSMRGRAVELPLSLEPCVLSEDNSRSSEEAGDWLSEMEKEFDHNMADTNETQKSPPIKKRRIDKSVVFGGKRARKESAKKLKSKNVNSSLSSDTSYEEDDDVFQSPAVLASRLRRRHLNKTPLSASSIKVLQESPILLDGKLSPSFSPRNRSCSDVTPNYQKRDRKRLVDVSDYKEASISKSITEDEEEPIARSLRKRLKLHA